MCITGCPYKKIYFNWKSGKSEKCIFCYPRIEAGQPTVCSETCVGRIRYLGVLLYDADAIESAASTEHEKDLYQRQLDVFLDPNDPAVIEQALKDGIPLSVIDAAQQSPVYKMAMDWKLALPLHPEYRTLPMVWYVPPLSPIQSAADAGELGSNGILPDVDSLRIPVQYTANLLTAGDTQPVLLALKRMLAMRHYKRAETVDGKVDTRALEEVGLSEAQAQEMYRYPQSRTTKIVSWYRAAIVNWRVTRSRRKAVVALPSATVATVLILNSICSTAAASTLSM